MSRSIAGFVDNFHRFDTLGGWAKCPGDDAAQPIDIVAIDTAIGANGTEIGRGRTTLLRGDDTRCGFALKLAREIDVADLTSGRVRVFGEYQDARGELTCIASMLLAFEAQCAGRRFAAGGDAVIRHLVDGATFAAASPYQRLLADAHEASRRRDGPAMLDAAAPLQGSPFLLPVGLKSPDGAAVIGHAGHMFILGGSNDLIAAYRRGADAASRRAAAAWLDLFRQRRARLQRLGSRYLQVDIPDKSSVIPERFPVPIEAPTALLAAIQEGARGDAAIAADYLDVLGGWCADPRREALFQRTDSHLSAYGCQQIMLAILRHLGADAALDTGFSGRIVRAGDLGGKFAGAPPLEELAVPADGDFAAYARDLELQERHVPSDGHNGGARLVWRNASAPVDRCVVAFANSFFGYGDVPTVLSWWAARCFREFHFIWETNLDDAYVAAVRPDVVICQSVERFMVQVAQA